eukprot:GHVN01053719.1.p1 GENE.GHVN01053719.1~~GHVN01053719.1.p1  ORF type:complete len:147 (+),score=28.24 GHVN01053719.1:588-1028(+)
MGDLDTLFDNNGYYVDSSGWFRSPGIENKLTGWQPSSPKVGDRIFVNVTIPGRRFELFVNSAKVFEDDTRFPLLDAKGGVREIWGFVSLTGTQTAFRMLQTSGPPGAAHGDRRTACVRRREEFLRQVVLNERGVVPPSFGANPPPF